MYSSITFGSQARGDSDLFSDTDILIVTNARTDKNKDMHQHYYTKKRLVSLKKAESLFLVHLKKEGRIIKDEAGWLQSFLNDVPDFIASKNKISLVERYLTILLSMNPSSEQTQWWCDCLYVFLRDYLIKYNSQFGIYSFSPHHYGQPIEGIRKTDLTPTILDLRYQKSCYRLAQKDVADSIDIIAIKNKLANVLALNINTNELLDVFLKSSVELEQYFKLRLLEGLYINNEVEITDTKILKYIKSPHSYNWDIRNTNLKSYIKVIS